MVKRVDSEPKADIFRPEKQQREKKIKPESDCIQHFPIDSEQQTDTVRLVPNQSENGKYNVIPG